jgi:hypothetical protein
MVGIICPLQVEIGLTGLPKIRGARFGIPVQHSVHAYALCDISLAQEAGFDTIKFTIYFVLSLSSKLGCNDVNLLQLGSKS